jgi:hypothetical protein
MQNMNIFIFILPINVMNYNFNKIDLFICNIDVCLKDMKLIIQMLHFIIFVSPLL